MKLYLILIKALQNAIEAVASSKTRRYFIEPLVKDTVPVPTQLTSQASTKVKPGEGVTLGDAVPKKLDRLVRTFLAILTRRSLTSTIAIGEEMPHISEYKFPTNFWELAKVRLVYASRSAENNSTPYYKYINELSDADLMTPAEVNMFFDMFNEAQPDDAKLVIVNADETFNQTAALQGFSALCLGEGLMADLCSPGVYAAEAAQVMGVMHPLSSDMVYSWKQLDQKGVGMWLTSLKW